MFAVGFNALKINWRRIFLAGTGGFRSNLLCIRPGSVEVVRKWFGSGSGMVRAWFGRGSGVVRARFGHGSGTVRARFGRVRAPLFLAKRKKSSKPIRSQAFWQKIPANWQGIIRNHLPSRNRSKFMEKKENLAKFSENQPKNANAQLFYSFHGKIRTNGQTTSCDATAATR